MANIDGPFHDLTNRSSVLLFLRLFFRFFFSFLPRRRMERKLLGAKGERSSQEYGVIIKLVRC